MPDNGHAAWHVSFALSDRQVVRLKQDCELYQQIISQKKSLRHSEPGNMQASRPVQLQDVEKASNRSSILPMSTSGRRGRGHGLEQSSVMSEKTPGSLPSIAYDIFSQEVVEAL